MIVGALNDVEPTPDRTRLHATVLRAGAIDDDRVIIAALAAAKLFNECVRHAARIVGLEPNGSAAVTTILRRDAIAADGEVVQGTIKPIRATLVEQ